MTLGPSALVRLAGTDIQVILNTNRTQTFEPDVFSNLGLDPASKDLLLIKSTNHFCRLRADRGRGHPSHPRQTQ